MIGLLCCVVLCILLLFGAGGGGGGGGIFDGQRGNGEYICIAAGCCMQ